jgi:hypothetical protein
VNDALAAEYSSSTMFDVGQRSAVRAAFRLAGYDGTLNTLPLDSGDELCFVLDQDEVLRLDVRSLEQVLQQLLGRKVWIHASVDDKTVPF